ncbi:MAG: hypothetical protein ACI92C_002796 [Neolewinella sp.]|jgi:hypothetical protein
MRLITLLLLTFLCTSASAIFECAIAGPYACLGIHAQRIMLFEKLTASKSDRVYEGERLKFKMKGDKFWQEGPIREMRPDIQALIINDRFVMLDEIQIIHRGNTAGAAVGVGLMTFGVGWSFWAGVGYNTDGDPTTQYGRQDLMTSLTTIGSGFLIYKLFGQRKYKTGKYKRLRVIDTSF